MTHLLPSLADPDALAYQLPAEATHHLLDSLRKTLPPPPASREARKRRDLALIAQIASLRANDAGEAMFVAQVVAATHQWHDCLCLAQTLFAAGDSIRSKQAHAQAASMMRQAQSAMRVLIKMQAERAKLYAQPKTTDAAERIEHANLVMLSEALAHMYDEEEEQEPDPPPIIETTPHPNALPEPTIPMPEIDPAPIGRLGAPASPQDPALIVTASPPKPGAAAQPNGAETLTVSQIDRPSRETKTETSARQPSHASGNPVPPQKRTAEQAAIVSQDNLPSHHSKTETPMRHSGLPEWLHRPEPDAFPIDPKLLHPDEPTPD